MGCEQIMTKLSFIMWGEDLNRFSVTVNEDGETVIRVDIHHLTKKAAEKVLQGIISLNRFPFTLDVVHGYNHGTALLEMIRNEFSNQRIQRIYSNSYNPGETYLVIE